MTEFLKNCTLCPRKCGADRTAGETGVCGQTSEIKVARASLHMWEEPCISGKNGSGTVFFAGCPLKCVYCQNFDIAQNGDGGKITEDELCELFFKLKKAGAHNINLVTPTHVTPQVANALKKAKKSLEIPIVYNCGGYELAQTLKMLENSVDIYLPDFKYADENAARKYSNAPDYPEVAKKAIEEMVRQCPKPVFDDDGMMKSGVLVRHLLLPGNLKNSKAVIEYLHKTYGDSIILSIMSQYTPMKSCEKYPELEYKTSRREYEKLVSFAESIGVKRAYVQSEESASENYIPKFGKNGIVLDF